MLDRPKSPEITAGEASGYTVALALIALAQFGSLDRWGNLAAVVTAGLVACATVYTTLGIRSVRHGTEQARIEALASAATQLDAHDPHQADLDELDEA